MSLEKQQQKNTEQNKTKQNLEDIRQQYHASNNMIINFSRPCSIRSVKSKKHKSDHSTICGAISNTVI